MHEIEFMLFSDLVLLTIIICGKLAMKRLEIYCINMFIFRFANYNYYLKSPRVTCDMSIYN